ncbi:MAG: ATP-binding protein [Deltaproteobacteria bacterium]|nr:ATP-binding protein [Deltaproteobacteria bacterium]
MAWDDLCGIPFFGFDRLLVAYTEAFPVDGTAEIERLISTYPAQRMAALRARTTLLARQAATVAHLSLLDSIVAQLPGGNKDFLPETSQVRELVREIAQLQRHLDAITRPIFRAPTARLLCAEIENFSHKIGGFDQPLASEFRAAASQWLLLARRQFQEVQAASEREPSPQVFRAGDPVNRENEAFVRRESVFGELEKQVMLSTGCPGIVLYGRRRMGKTTILRNVRGLLPTTVVPVFVSMQNAQAFTSLDHFLHHLTTAISEAWPGHPVPPLRSSDLPAFMQCLADWNTHCLATGKRLLLAVDEYETLDEKIGTGVLSLDLLATLRESIQSHRQLTWAFAGSHEITELSHAPWTSYLVSARTIEVPLFTLEETRLLLTEPLQYSSLWQDRTTERPRFPVEFWGEGGIERIHYEAGGWPHLVQLIAETAINLLNDEKSVRSLNAALLERTCNAAVGYGTNVLTQLLRDESTLPGEWEYLAAFRTCATQPPPSDNALQRSLPRRLLVENADNGEWRLRVPLMARWLRERG